MKAKELLNQLKAIRKEQKISQTELGEKVGLKQQYVYQLENGTHIPRFDTVCEIAEALGYEVMFVKTETYLNGKGE